MTLQEIIQYIYKFLNYVLVNYHGIFKFYNAIVFIEFIISFIILLILISSILKFNYINFYTLTFLNLIILIIYLTVLFQEYFFYSFYNLVGYEPANWKTALNKNDVQFLIQYLITGLTMNVVKDTGFWFSTYVVSFYKGNGIFSLFTFYVKLFALAVFTICLIIGYLIRKTLKISFEKTLLILFPLLLSTLVVIQTQDLIIAFLSIELQNLCLIFLMSLKKHNKFNIQLSVRFFILNSVGSLFIIFGIVILFSIFHTTNMSNIYCIFLTISEDYIFYNLNKLLLGLGMLLIGLMFKLGVGPFGLWLVDIYEYSLSYGVLIFSALPKISYFMFIFHLYLMTSSLTGFWAIFLKFFGILSIILGTFGALEQVYLKRLLAFSSLNYFGYILLSFVGFNAQGTVLCAMYLYVYMFISFYIWFVILYLEKVTKRNIVLTDLVIFRDHYPVLAYMLACCFLFLAGLPPFYLFFLKFGTFYVLLNSLTGWYIIIIFLFCNFISIYYYLNIIKILLFNPLPSKNYPCFYISTFTIYMILIFGFYCLSPFIFILLKKVYVLLNKLLKNYYSTIFSKKTHKILASKLHIVNPKNLILNTSLYKTKLYDKITFGISGIRAINIRNHPLKLLNNYKIAFNPKNTTLNPHKLIVKYGKRIDDFICEYTAFFNLDKKKYARLYDIAFYKFVCKIKDISANLNYVFVKKDRFFDYLINKSLNFEIKDFSKYISKTFITRLSTAKGNSKNYYKRELYKRLIKYYYIISGYNLKLNKTEEQFNNSLNRYIRIKFKRSLLHFRQLKNKMKLASIFIRNPRFVLNYHYLLKKIQNSNYITKTRLMTYNQLQAVINKYFTKIANKIISYYNKKNSKK